MRKALLGSCVLVAAVALFGAGYLVHGLTADDEGHDLTLTGREAAGRAEVALRQSDPRPADAVNIGISCTDDSFNPDTGDRSFNCSATGVSGFNFETRWRVNGTTGEAAPNPPVASFRLILTDPPRSSGTEPIPLREY